jgi:hypothetical protein
MSTQLVVSVSRPGQYAGNVTVTAPTNLPKGVSISPKQVSTTTTNATFTLKTGNAISANQLYPLAFTAIDGSGKSSAGTVTLEVVKQDVINTAHRLTLKSTPGTSFH